MNVDRCGGVAVAETLTANLVDIVFGTPDHPLLPYLARAGITVITLPDGGAAVRAAAAYARVCGLPGVVAATGTTHQPGPLLLLTTGDGAAAASAEAAADAVTGAFAAVLDGPPRTVRVDVPADVLDRPCTGRARPVDAPAPAPAEPDAVARAVELLGTAERPLVIAGGGAIDASDELTALVQALGAPVATTASGKGVVADGHPLSVGASVGLPAVVDAAADSDVVLVVGSGFACPEGVPAIHVDVVESPLRRSGADIALHGDATATVAAVRAGLPQWGRSIGVVRAASLRESCREQARADGRAFELVNDVLREVLPSHGVLVGGTTPVTHLGSRHFFPVPTPRLFSSGGLSAAVGACVAGPARPVAALLGTGAFASAGGELAAAVALGLPIPVVVVRDGSDAGGDGGSGGAHEVRANEPDDLPDLVEDAFEADRPTVIRLG
ncbi:thiamine pyrophosphate-dependent enzyme [Pseudonocardia sp.]|uniref:thiamine pyrophosphate-dependent enzyme n=1 Tax=Pseudonocardia sp. TaxID=60912 RepID=UPI0026122248|nr:thiamine pyrophosphate-dependent enzyme [Pseudonocardia sp.]